MLIAIIDDIAEDYLFQKEGDFDADFNFPDFGIYSFDSWYAACLSAGKIISKAPP